MSIVHPAEPFCNRCGVGHRIAEGIQPNAVSKTGGGYDKPIAFPFPDRVAVPGRLHVGGQGPAVGKDLPITLVVLVENHNQPRGLHDLPVRPMCVPFDNPYRQTSRDGLVNLWWTPTNRC